MEGSTIHLSNLMAALQIAIDRLEEYEKRLGPNFKSAQRAGFEDNLNHLKKDLPLIIIYSGQS